MTAPDDDAYDEAAAAAFDAVRGEDLAGELAGLGPIELDELGVWDAAVRGDEIVTEPRASDFHHHNPHGINDPEDHDFTIGGDFDPTGGR